MVVHTSAADKITKQRKCGQKVQEPVIKLNCVQEWRGRKNKEIRSAKRGWRKCNLFTY